MDHTAQPELRLLGGRRLRMRLSPQVQKDGGSPVSIADEMARRNRIIEEKRAVPREVKEACLFDDGHGISVAEDPPIPAKLFNRNCGILKEKP